MPSPEEINKRVADVERLTAFSAESLHVDERSAVSLADAKPVIASMQAVLKPFSRDVIELLDDSAISRLRQQSESLTTTLTKANQYRPEAAQAIRDQIITEVRSLHDQLWRELRLDYSFAVVRQLQPETLEAKIDALRATAETHVRESTAASLEKSEELLAQLQEIA